MYFCIHKFKKRQKYQSGYGMDTVNKYNGKDRPIEKCFKNYATEQKHINNNKNELILTKNNESV